MFTIGSLFSGIGGLELGLERAGLGPVVWQCEIDPFCRRVLARHWPNVTRFKDVTQPREWPKVEIICGGFPCQDVSSAGARRGLGGQRSGLWWHFAGVVRRVRPRVVVVENVASGKGAWLPHVRHSLHVLGYRTRAFALSAFDVGAPHLRRRIFVVAADTGRARLRLEQGRSGGPRGPGTTLAQQQQQQTGHSTAHGNGNGNGKSIVPVDGQASRLRGVAGGAPQWSAPPEFRRVDDGLSRRMDGPQLRALGNAVVPQCAEVIGRIVKEMLT